MTYLNKRNACFPQFIRRISVVLSQQVPLIREQLAFDLQIWVVQVDADFHVVIVKIIEFIVVVVNFTLEAFDFGGPTEF